MTEITDTESVYSIDVTFRDVAHFNKIVTWMNTNVGRGKENWTIGSKVLKHLRKGKAVRRTILVRTPDFDPSTAVFLTLI